jgi:hypothetical protein
MRPWAVLAAAIGSAALITWLSSIGGPHDAVLGSAVVLERLAWGGSGAALYLVAAAGWGMALWPWLKSAHRPLALAGALGLAVMVTLTHLMGVAGLLRWKAGAWLPVAIGIALLAWRGRVLLKLRRDAEPFTPAAWGFIACAGVAAAVMAVAAAGPPGWLWESEFGGYDALAYHLQLPREWHRDGRVWPVEHNVYSFLPNYGESAFLHVSILVGTQAWSAQYLHAGMAVVAAMLAGRAARAAGASRIGALAASATLLCVPWTVVTGSLAYNEMGVLAMLAGALIAAMDRGLSPGRRGVVAGLLVGVACGFKPAAIVLATPAVAVALAASADRRDWPGLMARAALAGLAALSPWLVRNFAACGNPVFPYLSGLFGPGHWSPEQFERFARGHRFDGGLVERLALLVLPDRDDPARPGSAVHRGLLHPQWSIFFPLAFAAIGALIAARTTRHLGLMLGGAVAAQIAAWMAFTHVQSRFLLPVALTGAVAIGVACRGRAAWGIAAATLVLAASTVWRFTHERHGRPNAALVGGTELFDGGLIRGEWSAATPARRAELVTLMGPEAFVNVVLGGSGVYLLGDATPFYFQGHVVYHTTWDTSPLGLLMRRYPGTPGRWNSGLRDLGVEYVLWNAPEVSRLHRSGWYDPLVTNDAVEAWLRTHARPVQAWPESGRYLFRLADPADAGTGEDPPENR